MNADTRNANEVPMPPAEPIPPAPPERTPREPIVPPLAPDVIFPGGGEPLGIPPRPGVERPVPPPTRL